MVALSDQRYWRVPVAMSITFWNQDESYRPTGRLQPCPDFLIGLRMIPCQSIGRTPSKLLWQPSLLPVTFPFTPPGLKGSQY